MSRNLSQPCTGKWAPCGEVCAGVAVELSEQGQKPARGAWTTPDASAHNQPHRGAGAQGGPTLSDAARSVWPTATAGDARSAGSRCTPGSSAHPGISLTDAARGDGAKGRVGREARPSLNPAWVCSLMGFPEGWV